MKLEWEERYDGDGNSYWEAKYNNHYFRIIQKLKHNGIEFMEDSSPELWLDKFSPEREQWVFLESAKYDMYRQFLNLVNQL